LSGLRFWKTQTVGNDFVLIHADDFTDSGFGEDLESLAKRVCARKFGIGSDGLLVLSADQGDLHLRMFNPDGTEDFCGNGLRCAALHGYRQGWVAAEHRIEHFGRLVHAVVLADGTVKSAIGPAVYEAEEVPLDTARHPSPLIEEPVEGYVGSAINAGSTHFVTFVEGLPNDEEFVRAGRAIENSPLFPERTSVIFAVETGVRKLKIRIWERGVGETMGCGTGSSAAAAEWMRKHDQAGEVQVTNPGGVLTVSADSLGGSLVTSSLPIEVYEGRLPAFTLQLA
jgi:diaminopimelate epimerase